MKPTTTCFVGVLLATVCWPCTTLTIAEKDSFDHLRRSVVRIQAVSNGFDWLRPFAGSPDQVSVGSGFVVQTKPYPLFATNAHVINDAKEVRLQLLLFGNEKWESQVVSVCPHFDLALLVLTKPDSFLDALDSRNISLQALEMDDRAAAMGDDVIALGFPLGQDSLKISKGNIAGNQAVDGNICIQSTAPLSPGSSGGPLLNAAGTKVVGVNFAKATEGENINYVIPAWRVSQLVRKHVFTQPVVVSNQPPGGLWLRLRQQVPKLDLNFVEANEALYNLDGCRRGVFVAAMGARSLLRTARPPVSERFFLTSVNGRDVDVFGMGLNPAYAADRVSAWDLFFMVSSLTSEVEFETCEGGIATKHNVSLTWRPEYDRGIRWVDEPNLEGTAEAFEMFGDISVMEMTENHVDAVLRSSGNAGPAHYLRPDYISESRLMVNYVRPGSYSNDVLGAGDVISKVNGIPVRTLDDFRRSLVPQNGNAVWTLETDQRRLVALLFNESILEALELADTAPYLLTKGVVGAAQQVGILAAPAGSNVSMVLLEAKRSRRGPTEAVAPAVRAAGPLVAQQLSCSGGPCRRSPVVTRNRFSGWGRQQLSLPAIATLA